MLLTKPSSPIELISNKNKVDKTNGEEEEGERDITATNVGVTISEGQKGESIISSISKTKRKQAQQLISLFNTNPNISWNNKKELIFRGATLRGSNITDLISDTLEKRQTLLSPNIFSNVFSKVLIESGVPKEWIKNVKMGSLVRAHKEIRRRKYSKRENNYFLSSYSRKSENARKRRRKTLATDNWLSSTSKVKP
jgi:hypothetical protein